MNHLFAKLKKSYGQTPRAYPEDPRETFRRHVWVSPYYEDELDVLRDLMGADRRGRNIGDVHRPSATPDRASHSLFLHIAFGHILK